MSIIVYVWIVLLWRDCIDSVHWWFLEVLMRILLLLRYSAHIIGLLWLLLRRDLVLHGWLLLLLLLLWHVLVLWLCMAVRIRLRLVDHSWLHESMRLLLGRLLLLLLLLLRWMKRWDSLRSTCVHVSWRCLLGLLIRVHVHLGVELLLIRVLLLLRRHLLLSVLRHLHLVELLLRRYRLHIRVRSYALHGLVLVSLLGVIWCTLLRIVRVRFHWLIDDMCE